MRAMITALAVVGVTAALVGCSSSSKSRVATSTRPTAMGHRLSYGALSVTVPAGWKIVHTQPPGGCIRVPGTFYILTESEITVGSDCSNPTGPPTAGAALDCFVGDANPLWTGGRKIRILGGDAYRLSNIIYVPGRTGQTVLTVGGPANVVNEILASAQRSRGSC